MSDLREKELLQLLKKGESSALQVFFNLYHRMLCQLAQRMVGDPDQAKDIVQDVFIRFWNGRHKLEITVSVKAYLRRAVVNASLNVLEKRGARRSLPLENAGQLTVNPTEEYQDHRELQVRVDQAIAALPVRTRAVFVLIRYEEMSYSEAADSLEISAKAVEKEMMKALKLLRHALQDYLTINIAFLALSLIG